MRPCSGSGLLSPGSSPPNSGPHSILSWSQHSQEDTDGPRTRGQSDQRSLKVSHHVAAVMAIYHQLSRLPDDEPQCEMWGRHKSLIQSCYNLCYFPLLWHWLAVTWRNNLGICFLWKVTNYRILFDFITKVYIWKHLFAFT